MFDASKSPIERAARREPGPLGPGQASYLSICGKELPAPCRSGESPFQEGVLQSEYAYQIAVDIGSGAMKAAAALVDNRTKKIFSVLDSSYIPMNLKEKFAADGGKQFSKQSQEEMCCILNVLIERILRTIPENDFPTTLSGIATAVFRTAENGSSVLKGLSDSCYNMPIRILSQEEEGALGFATAEALFPQIPKEYLVALDSGNGSFQISALDREGQVLMFGSSIGHGNVRMMLADKVRHSKKLLPEESGNPISKQEADALAAAIRKELPIAPDWFMDLVKNRAVIGSFGDGESIFSMVALAKENQSLVIEDAGSINISREDVTKVLQRCVDKTDTDLAKIHCHKKTATGAIHLSALMDHYGLQMIQYQCASGNTVGMFKTPYLWKTAGVISRHTSHRAPVIIEVETFQQFAHLVDKNTTVITDLDNTVFRSKTALGSVEWLQGQVLDLQQKGITLKQAFETMYPLWQRSQQLNEIVPVEQAFVEQLKTWIAEGITVIALTAREPDLILDETLRQLDTLGLHFLSAPDLGIENQKIPCNQAPILYKQGIVFADDWNSKGDALNVLLKQFPEKPKSLVFIDDGRHHVNSVCQAAQENKIPILGIHYSAAKNTPYRSTDVLYSLVDVQLRILEKEGTIPSDEMALQMKLSLLP